MLGSAAARATGKQLIEKMIRGQERERSLKVESNLTQTSNKLLGGASGLACFDFNIYT